ncbi:MAG: hypothetical protein MHPSP_004751, partial [Paramarteilia canceri]
ISGNIICPLLKPESVGREIDAVNSEYVKALSSEGFLFDSLTKTLIKKEYPHSKFNYGNRETLIDGKTDEELAKLAKEFYNKFYIPKNTKLCLYSS